MAIGLNTGFDASLIDAIFADLDTGDEPGCAVGIAIEGVSVYRKAFGLASMELPCALAPTMRMRIQSSSKHFISLAYLLLCERGLAAVDDPVERHLPELAGRANGVTMADLMGHTSGLCDTHALRYFFCGMEREVPLEDLIDPYRRIDALDYEPGTSWAYCNGAYSLLATAIERIGNQPLGDYLSEHIFRPVGMGDTMLRPFQDDIVPNTATNHTRLPSGEFRRSFPMGSSAGAGGIISTVDDMLRWLAHMDAPLVGQAETWRQMKTPRRLRNGTSTGYGCGLITGIYGSASTLFHGGSANGSNSQMLKVPEARLDIEIMVNRDDVSGWPRLYRILDALLPRDRAEQGSKPRSPLASGVFQSPTTRRVVELGAIDVPANSALSAILNPGAQMASLDGMALQVEPDRDGLLRPVIMSNPWKWSIRPRGDAGRPTSLILDYFGNKDELIRLEPPEGRSRADIVGHFRNRAVGIDVEIYQDADCLAIRSRGPYGSARLSLRQLADRIWLAKSQLMNGAFCGILDFASDGQGFSFSTPQLRNLAFERVRGTGPLS